MSLDIIHYVAVVSVQNSIQSAESVLDDEVYETNSEFTFAQLRYVAIMS